MSLKCSSCGSSDFKTLGDYGVCRHCGSKSVSQKEDFSKVL